MLIDSFLKKFILIKWKEIPTNHIIWLFYDLKWIGESIYSKSILNPEIRNKISSSSNYMQSFMNSVHYTFKIQNLEITFQYSSNFSKKFHFRKPFKQSFFDISNYINSKNFWSLHKFFKILSKMITNFFIFDNIWLDIINEIGIKSISYFDLTFDYIKLFSRIIRFKNWIDFTQIQKSWWKTLHESL